MGRQKKPLSDNADHVIQAVSVMEIPLKAKIDSLRSEVTRLCKMVANLEERDDANGDIAREYPQHIQDEI